MRAIANNIWVQEGELGLFGTTLGLRMTVVRLTSGGLWVHSPIAIDDDVLSETNKLGDVAYIVGPNNAHNLYLKEWCEAYPAAQLVISPGIQRKLNLDGAYIEMGEQFENPWADDLERVFMPGVSFFDESVFLHKQSKSLIVTDFIQNYENASPSFMQNFVLGPIGFDGICIAPPLKLGFMHKRRQDFNQAVQLVQTWEFERIVVTHGDIVEEGAKAHLDRLAQRFH